MTHSNPHLTERRAHRMLHEQVQAAVYAETLPLQLTAWEAPGEPVAFAEAVGASYAPMTTGTPWGLPWGTTWLHATGRVPAHWRQRDGFDVELVIDLGFTSTQPGFQAEGLVRRPDGSAVKAVNPLNQAVPWAKEHDAVDVYIEAASNPNVQGSDPTLPGEGSYRPTLLGRVETAPKEHQYTLRRVDVALRDTEVWELAQDLTVLLQLVSVLPPSSARRASIDVALERAIDRIDPRNVSATAAAARAALAEVLASPASASAHHVMATGHAHIDSAWLWPVRETKRKCVRTFASVLELMDHDPDFVFACSSAQQYLWVKEEQPELFERIRQRVAEGRFIPVGSMWLESDTNMPGSEAMARQMIEGKTFFMEELGVETTDVWLPDSFGYTGSLPQIIRGVGSRWFLSQKLSWNDSDTMPHHTFDWEGIDGSRVLAHFPPVDTYNACLSAAELVHAEENFAEKGLATSSIVPFGWGDGGGGPTREMLAAAARFKDLEGVPTVEIASPNTFFARTEEEFVDRPVWTGEMYLQFHRGTYTSQLRTKQGNRRSEHLLREAELWAAAAAVRQGLAYPYEELRECWRTVLRNQFHDILPGSCIGWVYDRVEQEYAEVAAVLEDVIASSARALTGEGDRLLRLNAAPSTQDGVPSLAIGEPEAPHGSVSVEQGESLVLDNGLLRVVIEADGTISSVLDQEAEREVLPPQTRAALLQLHRDVPRQWDAWDIDPEYRNVVEDVTAVTSLTVAQEPGCARVRIERPVGEASTLTEEIILRAGCAQVALSFDIDWHERQKLLKLAFPVDLMAAESTSEMQFGHVARPAHRNTSWDAARYEICAHRWIHVAEPGYGVAVLNDSTYGHDVTRGTDAAGHPTTTVRLSLVRAPLFPDPEADQGRHRLSVVLRPGASIADAVQEGYALNLGTREVRGAHGIDPLLRVDGEGVVVEAVKLAQDRSGDVIVRLYESLGARTRARVSAGFPVASVTAVDLLERPCDDVGLTPCEGPEAGVSFDMRPFQIITLRLRR